MNQFTDSVTEALQKAFADAQRRNQTEVTENHLLSAFLQDPQGYFYSILTNLGTQPQQLLKETEKDLDTFQRLVLQQLNPLQPLGAFKAALPMHKILLQAGKTPTLAAIIFLSPTGKMGRLLLHHGKNLRRFLLAKLKIKSKKSEVTAKWTLQLQNQTYKH